ncbi:MAG: DNA topoisomerase III [Eubacteriales bacterium]|nr:DNA topoisomerase III [Eubacteriales bacterium]
MAKSLFIAEKPSVAQEFAKALKVNMTRQDGYLEGEDTVVTWCVGHLVTMSYPEVYDEKYKKWSLATLPFLPENFLYEVIPQVKKQFKIVSSLLNRKDVTTIYVCTDSGREGEYIYRLVEQQAKVNISEKTRKRVWIDSQTEEEILRGIREAKDLSEYNALSDAAYLRAKEDYLMGINFSRLLTLKYGNAISDYLQTKYTVISVGRVMTCVLGMVVRREREIRAFVKTPFYRVIAKMQAGESVIEGEFRAVEGSEYYLSPKLYRENGFREKKDAEAFVSKLSQIQPQEAVVEAVERKTEKKNPPLLFNLAELQNECSKLFKISPDETLRTVQELYEKKLVTYPRTDARVLSTAVAKEITRNLRGLCAVPSVSGFAQQVLDEGKYRNLAKTRYVNDKQITDHYAIVPTGQGIGSLKSLPERSAKVYELISRRFLSIFYPPAVYRKISLTALIGKERFFASVRVLEDEGYLAVTRERSGNEDKNDPELLKAMSSLRKGAHLPLNGMEIREGETAPPKRYNSGSMILAMENAGQLIEDEELREQIKGSGIGTSATRADILKKLISINYISLNKKTQVLTPTQLGEMIFDVVNASIRSLLNPELTASWEKGLTYVAEGSITPEEYMTKLNGFVKTRTEAVLGNNQSYALRGCFEQVSHYYKKAPAGRSTGRRTRTASGTASRRKS